MSNSLPWFRMWSESVDDEKLRLLAFEDRWHFVALLCCKAQGLLERGDGLMRRKVAVKLGLQVRELEEVGRRLADVGLIDEETLEPLAWDKRQRPSDSSVERTRAWRERQQNKGDVTVTSPTRHGDTPELELEEEIPPPYPPPSRGRGVPDGDWTLPATVSPDVWADFEVHRKDIRQPLSALSRKANAKVLESLTFAQQREAVDTSIANRWRGLFAPKLNGSAQPAYVSPYAGMRVIT